MLLSLCAGGCANFRLPAIDPSGESIFLPAPNFTTVAPERGLGLGGLVSGGVAPAWQAPPQPELCDLGAIGGVPYSIYTPPPSPIPNAYIQPTLPTVPALPYSTPVIPPAGSYPAIPVVPNPLANPPLPTALQGATELTGQTSLNPRDGIPGRLTINPTRLVAPVGQEVILRASICGLDGLMMLNEPIEWMLSPNSVGTILEVDQNNKPLWRQLFRRPPYKVNGSYAMGLTSSARQMIPRGGPGPYDDLILERGQTWVSVTSSAEGATHVTGRANRVAGWEDRRASATIHWIDGQWRFPNPQSAALGAPAQLCTQVARATSGSPIAGWRVQYRIAGGTPAAFSDGTQATETTSDSRGQACVRLAPTDGNTTGVTHVQARIIRPGQGSSDLSDLVVGEGTTTVTWGASGLPVNPDAGIPAGAQDPTDEPPFTNSIPNPPSNVPDRPFESPPESGGAEPFIPARPPQLQVQANGPTEARVGQEVVYTFEVRNPDSSTAEGVQMTNDIPRGLQYLGSLPEGNVYGKRIVWELGNIPSGDEPRRVQVRYRVLNVDTIRNCAIVGWKGAPPIDDCQTTSVAINPIQIEIRGDESARIGQDVVSDIYVTNVGPERIDNLKLIDDYDRGLYHEQESPMEIPELFSLQPNETREFKVVFQVTGSGPQCHTATIRADGQILATAEDCINAPGSGVPSEPGAGLVIPPSNSGNAGGIPAVKIQVIGPREMTVGQSADFDITVTNTGTTPLTDLQIEHDSDPRLVPTYSDPPLARDGVNGNAVAWQTISSLAAGQVLPFRIRMQARESSRRACMTSIVRTRERVGDSSDHCIRIFPSGSSPSGGDTPEPFTPFGTGSTSGNERVVGRPNFSDTPPMSDGLEVSIQSLGSGGLDPDRLTYLVQVTNTGDEPEKDVVLMVETPEGTEFVTSLNPPMIRASRTSSDQRTVEFNPISTLRVDETAKFRVVVERDRASVGRFRAKVTSHRLPDGAVFSDRTGP